MTETLQTGLPLTVSSNDGLGGWLRNERATVHNDSNCGFWDKPAEERAKRMRAAAERGGAANFFDLPPEERAQMYEDSQDDE